MIIQNPYIYGFNDMSFTIVLDRILGYTLYRDEDIFEKVKGEFSDKFDDIDMYISDVMLKNADIETLYNENLNDEISITNDEDTIRKYSIGERKFRIQNTNDDVYFVFDIYVVTPFQNSFELIKQDLIEVFKKYHQKIKERYISLQQQPTKIDIIDLDKFINHKSY